ncbi:MAG: cofactor-independent phosphoglycerate mutase [Phycisphaerae bacterium]|nr:cofactor-independent phosphoglycerate mutase [Phycisphaerae bacterium]
MKYAIVIPDGAADLPLEELHGQTPLEVARKPQMDWIAAHGKCGMVHNIPKGLACGSDVAILSVVGYDPRTCYTGRAPLEAAAQGLKIGPDEWVFRCNLVTIIDGIMEDHSAGHISTEEAGAIVDELNRSLARPGVHFYRGVSYRHLMIYRGDCQVRTTPPHDILGQRAAAHLPTGQGAKELRGLMERGRELLVGHEINTVRRDLGENPATDIWLWGEGQMPQLTPFTERFGLRAAAVAAVDLVRGLARLIGWDVLTVQGATGYLDTNSAGKGAAAVAALDNHDLVFVHVEAPDEAGHNANIKGKIAAIEQIDQHIVGPLLKRLQAEGPEWRILVLPDHPTPCTVRTHTRDAVPFAMAGKRVESVLAEPFSEAHAAESDLHIARGHELMQFFLTIR